MRGEPAHCGVLIAVLATTPVVAQTVEVRGRVVDELQRPLPGAGVLARQYGELDTASCLANPAATADADGRWRLRIDASAAESRWVLIAAPGRLGLRIAVAAQPQAPAGVFDVGDVSLPNGDSRHGRVVGVDGAPIAGARIEVLDAVDFPLDVKRPGEYAVLAFTDALGVFHLPGVAPGMAAEVSADGYATQQITTLGASAPTTIELRATGHVAGRVVDDHGLPVAARVTIEGEDGAAGDALPTDADGRFRQPLRVTGRYRVVVQASGHQRFVGEWLDAPADEVVVALQRVEVRLVPVRARDAVSGAPIRTFRAAVVWVSIQSPWYRLRDALDTDSEASNDDGEATLHFPVPDMPPLLRPYIGVQAPGYAMAMHKDVSDPVVELERAAVVEGDVRDAATGAPLIGVQVWAVPIMRKEEHGLLDGTDALAQPPGAVRTGADGEFRLEGLRPGELILHARHPQRPARHRKVTALAGQVLRADCAVDAGCALSVVAQNAIAPGTVVRLVPVTVRVRGELPQLSGIPDQHLSYERAFTNGTALFEGLPADRYRVALRLPVAPRSGAPVELFFAEVDVGPMAATVEVGEIEAASVRGRIKLDAKGLDPGQLLVTSVSPRSHPMSWAAAAGWRSFVSASGDFELRVTPCSLRLGVIDLRTRMLVHVTEVFEVKSAVNTDLEVRPATLVVRPVLDPSMPRGDLRLWTQRTDLLDQEQVAWSQRAGGRPLLLPLESNASEWRLPVAPGPILLQVLGKDVGATFRRPRPQLFELAPGHTTVLELPVSSR